MTTDPFLAWLTAALGHMPRDVQLFRRALTHGSHGGATYERLEFLGDRVLGLVIADWLYRQFPDEPEGVLTRRFHILVSGETCADIARAIGVAGHLRLGKQARDDGAQLSTNVLGDAMEALIGAVYVEAGYAVAEGLIKRLWESPLARGPKAPVHPKSALQEWALAHGGKLPVYSLLRRTGAHHAPRFTVSVAIPGRAEAQAEGASKQEAETEAAAKLLGALA